MGRVKVESGLLGPPQLDRFVPSLQQEARVGAARLRDSLPAKGTDLATLQAIHDNPGSGIGKLTEHLEVVPKGLQKRLSTPSYSQENRGTPDVTPALLKQAFEHYDLQAGYAGQIAVG